MANTKINLRSIRAKEHHVKRAIERMQDKYGKYGFMFYYSINEAETSPFLFTVSAVYTSETSTFIVDASDYKHLEKKIFIRLGALNIDKFGDLEELEFALKVHALNIKYKEYGYSVAWTYNTYKVEGIQQPEKALYINVNEKVIYGLTLEEIEQKLIKIINQDKVKETK